ncbi:MAG: AAA family ATPase, partial [Acetatifactor sp.]|nr:AAA family ATPase [Acetatifactor sp.]
QTIENIFKCDAVEGIEVHRFIELCIGKVHSDMKKAKIYSAKLNTSDFRRIDDLDSFISKLVKYDKQGGIQYMFWIFFAYAGARSNGEDSFNRLRKACECAAELEIDENELCDIVTAVSFQYNHIVDPPKYSGERTKIFGNLNPKRNILKQNNDQQEDINESLVEVFVGYLMAKLHTVFVDTVEEEKAIEVIKSAAEKNFTDSDNRIIYEWNIAEGLIKIDTRECVMDNFPEMGAGDLKKVLVDLLANYRAEKKNIVYILRTADKYLHDPEICGYIKVLTETLRRENKSIFLFVVCRSPYIDPSIEKTVYLNNSIGYPNEKEIKKLLEEMQTSDLAVMDEIVSKCKGLTGSEIKSVIALSKVKKDGNPDGMLKQMQTSDLAVTDEIVSKPDGMLKQILFEKKQIIKKSGLVELVDTDNVLAVGGLRNLMKWLDDKSKIIKNPKLALENKVDLPRGVLLIGMPGCGKSLAAKKTANMFNVPLIKMEMGSLMNKYQGESEHNFRDALKLAEAISPCVLWIDELEKAINNGDNNGQSESSARILGFLLNWMQERTSMTFVMATANEVKSLPTELLRKGRFDEVFFVDLPNVTERAEILKLHIESRGISYEEYDKNVKEMDNFSGAEIEYVVRDVVEKRFLDILNGGNGEITQEMFDEAIKNTTPLYESMKDDLNEMRDFCKKKNFKQANNPKG